MHIIRSIRLGLLHVAVTITFVLINGVLNRVMIHDLHILASVVAALVVLPYFLSPVQVWIGQHSDTHALFGYRRTPYIAVGVILCVAGAVATPYVALLMARDFVAGLLIGVLAFGAWGIGYNLAVVGYLSLASDLSEERLRSRTIAVMWFMMIVSIIISAISISRALEPYSDAQLVWVFQLTGLVALLLAAIGLVGLEPRYKQNSTGTSEERHSQLATIRAVAENPQARLFFVYLILLLAAILGQDILLEPYGAHEFGMTIRQTTQLTATWGGATLLALLAHGFVLNRWLSKKAGATIGAVLATLGFLLIAGSGMLDIQAIFVPGVAVLGFGTGLSTSTNLGLMLDMTTVEQAGLYIGAWGVANATARGVGMLLGSVLRDVITALTGSASAGYISVFLIEAVILASSLILLRRIDVASFRKRQMSISEMAVMAGDA